MLRLQCSWGSSMFQFRAVVACGYVPQGASGTPEEQWPLPHVPGTCSPLRGREDHLDPGAIQRSARAFAFASRQCGEYRVLDHPCHPAPPSNALSRSASTTVSARASACCFIINQAFDYRYLATFKLAFAIHGGNLDTSSFSNSRHMTYTVMYRHILPYIATSGHLPPRL